MKRSLALLTIVFVLVGLTVYFFILPYRENKGTVVPSETALTEEALRNAAYAFPTGELKLFSAGRTEVVEEKGVRYWSEIDKITLGDLNGDNQNDAVIVLIDMMDALEVGGTGASDMSVAAVLGGGGLPLPISPIWIGQRRFVEIESVRIEDGFIRVNMRRDGISETRSFRLEDEGLVDI